MIEIPDELAEELIKAAIAALPQPPPIPDHVQQARDAGTEEPSGVHTCQSGRADGAAWFTTGDHWWCPFCLEHGPGFAAQTGRDHP